MTIRVKFVLLWSLAFVYGKAALPAEEPPAAIQKVDLGNGIYQFIAPDPPGEVNGNSIAVVNERDVLVFDTNILPSSARAILGEIRKITNKPVRYVVNSHWHPDHWDGNEVYAKEFPDVEVIASKDTRRLMENTMKVYEKTIVHQAAKGNEQLDQMLKTGKNPDGTSLSDKDRKDIEDQQRGEKEFFKEYDTMHPVLPTLTFDNSLTLYHGGREFRIMHFIGNTAGDTAIYLPKDRVLLAGDLLTVPVPFGADSHPGPWIESLKVLGRLDSSVIVPGHGAAQHDKAYLNLMIETLQFVEDHVHDALLQGMTLEETRKFVKMDEIRKKFTHDDPDQNQNFDGNFGDPIVRQVYDEATEELEMYQ
jgi:cyclase